MVSDWLELGLAGREVASAMKAEGTGLWLILVDGE
jgi:hypothetical protein